MSPKHLIAEFTARGGSEARVAELVAGYAAEVRAESGCLAFDPFTREDDARRWVVIEAYRDEAAFQAHITSEHNRVFNAALAEHVEGGASSLFWLTPPAAGRSVGAPSAP